MQENRLYDSDQSCVASYMRYRFAPACSAIDRPYDDGMLFAITNKKT